VDFTRLRPYQQQCVESIRAAYKQGARRVLLQSPVGSGKTVMFAAICATAATRGKSVLMLVHRRELVKQASESLRDWGIMHGVIAAGWHPTPSPVQVASVQTLARRHLEPPTLVVCDESHHVLPENTWGKLLARWPAAWVLGVTATPSRLDGKGLGGVFQTLINGPTVRDLTEQGFLAPVAAWAPPGISTEGLHIKRGDFDHQELDARVAKLGSTITGDAVRHYQKYGNNERAIAFCVSVPHLKATAGMFNAAGIPSAPIDGGMTMNQRDQTLWRFRVGQIRVLTSCELVSEGFDLPSCAVAISLRPTASLNIAVQQWGRIMRPAPGKRGVLLDHAGNVLRHGLPADDREWTLDGGSEKRKPRDTAASIRQCKICFAVAPARATVCPACGAAFEFKFREVEQADGELERIQAVQRVVQARREVGRARDYAALVALEKQRGYRRGWAAYVWAGRQRKGARG
jgi:DNA repair protein RadD